MRLYLVRHRAPLVVTLLCLSLLGAVVLGATKIPLPWLTSTAEPVVPFNFIFAMLILAAIAVFFSNNLSILEIGRAWHPTMASIRCRLCLDRAGTAWRVCRPRKSWNLAAFCSHPHDLLPTMRVPAAIECIHGNLVHHAAAMPIDRCAASKVSATVLGAVPSSVVCIHPHCGVYVPSRSEFIEARRSSLRPPRPIEWRA